jgi:hypothetical protein
MLGAVSYERTGCRLQLLLVLASAVIFGSECRGARDHILLSQIRDFPFRRLLRLAGLRWRYSVPPPHRVLPNQSQSQKSKVCYDRLSVGQSALVLSTHLGLTTTFLFLSDSGGFVDGRPL